MSLFRASLRLFLVVLWTGTLWLIWQAGNLLLLISGHGHGTWRHLVIRTWATGMIRIIGILLEVSGSAPLTPFILVSNHLSYIDILVYMAVLDCRLISKSEVSSWPVLGALARQAGTVFIDRELTRDVVRVGLVMEDLHRRGEGVIFFPEGTSSSGMRVMSFRSGLLSYAAVSGVPVHFSAIRYETRADDPAASRAVCWWGDMTFADHFFRFLSLRGVRAELVFGSCTVTNTDRKKLATELREKVESLFNPVRREISPAQ
jgi:1-acyl-sn-glycerol-3-phosphate acyltransferase